MPTNNPTTSQSSTQSKASAALQEGTAKAAKLGERLEEGAETLTESALARVRDAREQAASGLEQQRGQIAQRVRKLSDVLRAGSDLSSDDELARQLLVGASERIERVADYIGRATPNDIVEDLHGVARNRPGLFFGGAFLIGLAVGRFAKSSGSNLSASARMSGGDYEDEDFEAPRRQVARPMGTQRRATMTTSQREPAYDAQEESSGRSAQQESSGRSTQPGSQTAQSAQSTQGGSASGQTGNTLSGYPGSSSSSAAGSAAGSGIQYGGTTTSSQPKPQTGSASSSARSTEPGEGNKS